MLIPTDQNISSISDIREDTLGVLAQVQKLSEPMIVMHRNSPKAVILSIQRYNELMKLLEDYLDEELAVELERKAKKMTKKDYIPMEQLHRKYGINV
ncbi:hypothetical protein COW80_01335 [Candidatus Beckwithbacteria bacterium CG22_combo_CG10-13_8_21_14_all_01_47_9]|uniref:Antitoxin n=2 Tax=Candidatus Beckwithiibacteriota TaxID=1752726 RepID=A0A2H0E1G9_9BACT|nr:MAG: hypothetical protein AUJ59_02045 [Candidatus Beckwithbacteria bacterium CG1_02_47_37]PIP88282.1 MAG: hypothetical protein COW80_01335 [Candidatus Beckwithbacteria bacterium CG22_combo_CG10-13_8_21_14_all_01_47_9]